jgi:hypothetical protein
MYTTVSQSDFHDAFRDIRPDSFSYDGLVALFEWLEELEDSTAHKEELDVIALCCDFNEYVDLGEFHGDYDKEEYPDLETLRDHTTVIEFGDSFIIQVF